MLSKNNYNEKVKKYSNNKNQYSIRKLSIGVASTLIGISFFGVNSNTVGASTTASTNSASIASANDQAEASSTSSNNNKDTTVDKPVDVTDTWEIGSQNSKIYDGQETSKIDADKYTLTAQNGEKLDTSSVNNDSFQWVDKDGNPVAENPKDAGTYYAELTDSAKEKLKEANPDIEIDVNTTSEYKIEQGTATATLKGYDSKAANNEKISTNDLKKNNKIHVELNIPGSKISEYNLKDGDYAWYDDNNDDQLQIDAPSKPGTYYIGLTDQGKTSIINIVNTIAGYGTDDEGNKIPNVKLEFNKENAVYYIYDSNDKNAAAANSKKDIVIPEGTVWTTAGWTRANPDHVAKEAIVILRNYDKDNSHFNNPQDKGLNVTSTSFIPTEFGADISNVVIDKDDIKAGNKILLATITVANDYATTADQELPLSVSSLEDGTLVHDVNTDQTIGTLSVTKLDNGEIDFWLNVTNNDSYGEDVTIKSIQDLHTGYINHKNDFGKLGVLTNRTGQKLKKGSTITQNIYTATAVYSNRYTVGAVTNGLSNVPGQGNPTLWLNPSSPTFGANYVNPALGVDHDDLQKLVGNQNANIHSYTKAYLVEGNNIDFSNLTTFERNEISPVENQIKFESSDAVPDDQGNMQLLDKNKQKAIKMDNNLSIQDLIAQTPDGKSAYSLQDDGSALVIVKVNPNDNKLTDQEITDYVKSSQYYNINSDNPDRTLENTLKFYHKIDNQSLRTAVMLQAGLKNSNAADSWGMIYDLTPGAIRAGVNQKINPVYYKRTDSNGSGAVFRTINVIYKDEQGKEVGRQPRTVLIEGDTEKTFSVNSFQNYEFLQANVDDENQHVLEVNQDDELGANFKHTIFANNNKNHDVVISLKKINNAHNVTYTVIDEGVDSNSTTLLTEDTSLGVSVLDSDFDKNNTDHRREEAFNNKLSTVIGRLVSQGYELVSNDASFTDLKKNDYKVTIKVKHGTTTVNSSKDWPAGVADGNKIDLSKTITRRITVIGLPTTGNSITQTATYTRSATVDNVTKQIIGQTDWQLLNNKGWDSYSVSSDNVTAGFKIKSITLNGEDYFAVTDSGDELTGVAAVTPDVNDSNINVVIAYEGARQEVHYQWIDTDSNGQQVGKDIVLTGTTGTIGTPTLQVPENYVLATGEKLPESYFFKPTGNNPIQIKLKHKIIDVDQSSQLPSDAKDGAEKAVNTSSFSENVHRTITITDPHTGDSDYSQEVILTRTGKLDLVTHVVTFNNWTKGTFAAVTVPKVDGYTPSGSITEDTAEHGYQDPNIHITYSADTQSVNYKFVDDGNNGQQVGQTIVVSGVTDETVDPTKQGLILPSEDYDLVGELPTSYKFDTSNQDQIIHLKHGKIENVDQDHIPDNSKDLDGNTLTKEDLQETVQRTIIARMPQYDSNGRYAGTQDQDLSQAIILIRTATIDKVTKQVLSYSDWSTDNFAEKKILQVMGYKSVINGTEVTNIAGDKVQHGYQDPKIVVTYIAQGAKIQYKFIDDDNDQRPVGELIVVSGKTDQTVNTDLTLPENYLLVDGQTIPEKVYLHATNDTVEIHLKHKHETQPNETKTVTRTIVDNVPGQEANKKVQSVNFTRTVDKDLVTNEITYGDWTSEKPTWDAYTAIGKAGYTANQNVIAQTSVTNDTQDQTINITYTANDQTNTVTIVDDDNNGSIVDSSTIKGRTDGITNWQVDIPENYQLITGQTASGQYKFTANRQIPIELHVTHKHEMQPSETKTVTRTIIDNVPGQEAVKKIQSVDFTRTVDQDLVTGNITYGNWTTDNASWDTYTAIGKVGYTADQSAIAQANVTNDTENQTIKINYKANAQSVAVRFVDDDNQGIQVGEEITKTGTTDQTINDFNDLKVADNYQLADGQSLPNSYIFTADNNQVILVHLKHKHQEFTDSHTVTRTINDHVPGQATKTTKQQVIFTRTGDKDLVTNKIIYSDWQADQNSWDAYTPDKVKAYTPSLSTINQVNNLTPYSVDQTVNIDYRENTATVVFHGYDERLNLSDIDLSLYHIEFDSKIMRFTDLGIDQSDLTFIDKNGNETDNTPGQYEVKLKQSALDKIQKQFDDYHLTFTGQASFALLNNQQVQYIDKEGNVIQEDKPIIGYDQEKKAFRPHLPHGWQFVTVPDSITVEGGKTQVVIEHTKTTVTADQPKSTNDLLPHNPEKNYPSGVDHDDLNKEVSRTIFVNLPDHPQTIVQKAVWIRDAEVDEVNGEITYTDWKLVQNDLSSYRAPAVNGYHPSIEMVEAVEPAVDGQYDDVQIDYAMDAVDNDLPVNEDNNTGIEDIVNVDSKPSTTDKENAAKSKQATATAPINHTVFYAPLGLSLFKEKPADKHSPKQEAARPALPKSAALSKTEGKTIAPLRGESLVLENKQDIKANENSNEHTLPQTGESDDSIIWLGLILSGLSLSSLFLKRKKERE